MTTGPRICGQPEDKRCAVFIDGRSITRACECGAEVKRTLLAAQQAAEALSPQPDPAAPVTP